MEELIQYIRAKYDFMISEIAPGSAIRRAKRGGIVELKGRDAVTGLPKTLTLTAAEVISALRRPSRK
jgi:actin-like ATPase involved in cell morphogenesis